MILGFGFCFLFFLDKVLPGWSGTHTVRQDILELTEIHLPAIKVVYHHADFVVVVIVVFVF
jgi:fumarate reductase subunit D